MSPTYEFERATIITGKHLDHGKGWCARIHTENTDSYLGQWVTFENENAVLAAVAISLITTVPELIETKISEEPEAISMETSLYYSER